MATLSPGDAGGSTVQGRTELQFARLLVPIDFSSAARAALTLALRLAELWDSQLILFHASGFDANDEFLDYTGVPWGRSDVLEETRTHLRTFAELVAPSAGDRVDIVAVREDDPVRAVVDACRVHDPSLVVLGEHPHARRRLRRSRSERIMRKITCGVVLVRGAPEAPVDADM